MTGIYKTPAGARLVRERYLDLLRRWPVASEHLRVPTREGETFVLACGPEDGPPLLLLHGSGATTAMWAGDVATWASDFRVYAVDLIGEPGLSAASRPPLASEAYALWLDDVLRALGLGRVSMVGVSLGGWLALDFATRRPDRVERLVLLSPSGIGRRRLGFLVKVTFLLLLGRRGRRKALESALGGRAVPGTAAPRDAALADFALLIFEHFRPRLENIPTFDDDTLRRLTPPTLVIVGGRDAMLDSHQTSRRLRSAAPEATVRLLPDAGHYLQGQAASILDFLRDPTIVGHDTGHAG
jgi:pimeloyl-ACP methyl ester carboxylesterase